MKLVCVFLLVIATQCHNVASFILFPTSCSKRCGLAKNVPRRSRLVGRQWQHGHIRFPTAAITTRRQKDGVDLIVTSSCNDCDNGQNKKEPDNNNTRLLGYYTRLFGMLSGLTWLAISIKVLSFHPDPKFVHCTLQHNLWTMAQAWCFPLCVGGAAIQHVAAGATTTSTIAPSSPPTTTAVGLVIACAWLLASTALPSLFCFGYDLIPTLLKRAGILTFGYLLVLVWSIRKTTSKNKEASRSLQHRIWVLLPKRSASFDSKLWWGCTLGMFCLTLLPLVRGYPMATIPSILGKRLSRPATGFYALATTMCLELFQQESQQPQTTTTANHTLLLARGLQWGCSLHVLLVMLKLIGVDDGGLLLQGNGLWQWYPAMMQVPVALGASLVVHIMTALSSTRVLQTSKKKMGAFE